MKWFTATVLLLISLQPLTSYGADFDRVEVERETMQVLDKFITSFSAKDPAAHAATYHFPHFRLARGAMNVWETEEEAVQSHINLFRTLPDTGWYRSVWVHRRIVTMSESKVHVDTRFKRLREDGSEIGSDDSLYVLIKEDGRWAVKMRSSFL